MVQQSYKEVFVTNNPTLLADGATVETIVAGQIGIIDPKTGLAETTPTYANQKAIKIVWGTTDNATLSSLGVPNENIYSKLILGRKITDFKGYAADPTGVQQIVVLGNIGSGTLDLTAQKGEVKWVYLKLTGSQIDKEFSLQGNIRIYSVVDGLVGDAGVADPDVLANQLVEQINADKQVNRYVTATKITNGAYRGVQIAANLISRVTDEATRQYFPRYEQESVHIQISEFDPNYNNDPDVAVSSWTSTQTQAYSPAAGHGAGVAKEEEWAKGYHLRYRSFDPVIRAIEGYSLVADPASFYDLYVLSFGFNYQVGGWSEKHQDQYKLHVYFQTGEGTAFETAINGYIDTIGLEIDPVTL